MSKPITVLIELKKGVINYIYQDTEDNIRFLIADYDCEGADSEIAKDADGVDRILYEQSGWFDTRAIEDIVNKDVVEEEEVNDETC